MLPFCDVWGYVIYVAYNQLFPVLRNKKLCDIPKLIAKSI